MQKYKLYGKKNCAGCDTVKQMLESKGYGYEYVDVMTNMDAMRGLMEKGLRGVPQLFLNDELVGSTAEAKAHFGY